VENKCINCGEEKGQSIFIWVDDESWKKMGYKPTDFVCAYCTLVSLNKTFGYAYLFTSPGNRIIKEANMTINAIQKI
jgi:hypothetical protein